LPDTSELGGLRVVLVATRNPLNIGASARAMSNFGLTRLRVVNPFDLAFREARSAVGASHLLHTAEEHTSIAAAIADCTLVVGTTAARNRELQQPLVALQRGAGLIRRELSAGNNVALLFGSEKRGLSNQDFSYCHWLIRIPTCDPHPSMNLGQAVAVCLYELARQPRPRSARKLAAAATCEQLERLTVALVEALRISGYANPRSVSFDENVRRTLRRLALSAEDADSLLGMLRQIIWKLRSAS
jgi:tRNA/rRNA methyltransferase